VVLRYLILFSAIFVISCGSNTNDTNNDAGGANNEPVPASFLDLSDFSSDSVYSIPAQNVESQLNSIDFFLYDHNLITDLYTYAANVFLINLPDCEEIQAPKYIKKDDGTFQYSYSFELKQCFQDADTSNSIIYEEYSYSAMVDDIIFIDDSGNTLDVSGYLLTQVPARYAQQYNIKHIITITTYNTDSDYRRTSKYVTAVHGKDSIDTPCIFSEVMDDCVYRYIKQVDIDGKSNTQDILTVVEYNDVVRPGENLPPYSYYTGGSINFRINNWTGTVEYAGDTQLPYYRATDGEIELTGYLQDLTLQ
jgi:hypothetical protein